MSITFFIKPCLIRLQNILFAGKKHREKLTLNFDSGSGSSGSSKGLHLNLGPIAPPRDLVDASLPLDRQG